MKKGIYLIVLICIALLLSSCSLVIRVRPSETAVTPETAISGETAEIVEAAAPGEETIAENTDDSGLTLAGIKKAAQEAGYEVGEVDAYQMDNDPKPADGFNLIYMDDYSQSYIPVFEFNNTDDALAYAEQINGEGYYRSIVNGKYLTMTNAKYGVVMNDNEKNLLVKLLEAEVTEFTEADLVIPEPAEDYAGACLQIKSIYNALDKTVNKSVLLYDKAAAEDKRISASFVTFSLLSSGDLSFTSNLCEDQTQLDAVVQLWEMFGVADMKLIHDAANEYILTGKRMGLDTTFEIQCSFNPETGSLRLLDTDGDEVFELYEFVPLDGDKYAFQTLYERAIVEYKDGKIISFIYSLSKREKELTYNPASDGIYGKNDGIDEAWVSVKDEDSYDQFISGTRKKLDIAAESFTGDRLKIEIDIQ
ncbi:MAG: hypothetical protein ACYCWE_15625 [Eubacteriales bacterium]